MSEGVKEGGFDEPLSGRNNGRGINGTVKQLLGHLMATCNVLLACGRHTFHSLNKSSASRVSHGWVAPAQAKHSPHKGFLR